MIPMYPRLELLRREELIFATAPGQKESEALRTTAVLNFGAPTTDKSLPLVSSGVFIYNPGTPIRFDDFP